MANLVRLESNRVEFPFLSLNHPITPPLEKLQEGLEAFRTIRRDLALQSLPVANRREVTDFLRQFGQTLYKSLFPGEQFGRLDPRAPLLLQLPADWEPYPWELMHDGRQWLALGPGIIRMPYPPVPMPDGYVASPLPVRLMAVTASPLPTEADPELMRQESILGSRFVSVPWVWAEPGEDGTNGVGVHRGTGYRYRSVTHASVEDFEQALAAAPHVLHFSGYSQAQGWMFETNALGAKLADLPQIRENLRGAVRNGLRVLVMSDSLSLLDAEQAGVHTRALLETGLPALIRNCGRTARLREQDYLRTLAQSLAEGFGVFEGHLASIRRLHRRFDHGWDWSFFRLYTSAVSPNPELALDTVIRDARGDSASPPSYGLDEGTWADYPSDVPPPPHFSGRRRAFGRFDERVRFAEALKPGTGEPAPPLYLTGPPGSGKTTVALDLARRLRKCFTQIIYLHQRDLPIADGTGSLPQMAGDAPTPVQILAGHLARNLGRVNILGRNPGDWLPLLRVALDDGEDRLIIIDRLERHGGFIEFCEFLENLPNRCRVIVLARELPALDGRLQYALAPLSQEDMARIHGAEFIERLQASPFGDALTQLCAQDCLLGRVFARSAVWPPQDMLESLALAVASSRGDPAELAKCARMLLAELLARLVPGLSTGARKVLQALSLFVDLVHRDVVAALADFEPKALGKVLTELQWFGLVDSFQDDLYLAVPPRLQEPLMKHTIDRRAYERLQPKLLRTYRSYLAELALNNRDSSIDGPTASGDFWSWRPQASGQRAADIRSIQRIGVERVNVAELVAMLEEEQAWEELEALANAAEPVDESAQGAELMDSVNRGLLAAGEAQGDAGIQSRALNGLARPLVAAGRFDAAAAILERALPLASQATGQWETLEETYLLLSQCYIELGQLEAASNLVQSALELARQLGNGQFLVDAMRGMVNLWKARGEGMEQGIQLLLQQIKELESKNQPAHAAMLRAMLAEAHLNSGHVSEAALLFDQALSSLPQERGTGGHYRIFMGLAEVALAKSEGQQALEHYRRALEVSRGQRDEKDEDALLTRICLEFESNGKVEQAMQGNLCLRRLRERKGDTEGVIRVLDVLGGLYYQLGELDLSTHCYQERLRLQDSLPA